jgi:hypothetical protein
MALKTDPGKFRLQFSPRDIPKLAARPEQDDAVLAVGRRIFSRPQPDRAGLQQIEGASAPGRSEHTIPVCCAKSVVSSGPSTHKNAGISLGTPAMFKYDRNPL